MSVRGGGVLILRPGRRVFLALRSEHVQNPYRWGLPGGKAEPGEGPAEVALREATEELGPLPTPAGTHLHIWQDTATTPPRMYSTLVWALPEAVAGRWTPDLNQSGRPEHCAWGWFDLDAVLMPCLPVGPVGGFHAGSYRLLRAWADQLPAGFL